MSPRFNWCSHHLSDFTCQQLSRESGLPSPPASSHHPHPNLPGPHLPATTHFLLMVLPSPFSHPATPPPRPPTPSAPGPSKLPRRTRSLRGEHSHRMSIKHQSMKTSACHPDIPAQPRQGRTPLSRGPPSASGVPAPSLALQHPYHHMGCYSGLLKTETCQNIRRAKSKRQVWHSNPSQGMSISVSSTLNIYPSKHITPGMFPRAVCSHLCPSPQGACWEKFPSQNPCGGLNVAIKFWSPSSSLVRGLVLRFALTDRMWWK